MARRGTNHIIWNTVVAAGAMLGTAACGGKQTAPQAPSPVQVEAPAEVPVEAPPTPPPVEEVAPPAPPAPKLFSVNVESTPAGAEVWADGAKVGVTPVQLPAMTEGTSVQLKLVRKGYVDQEVTVVADADKTVPIALEAAAARPRTTTSPRKHGRGFILS